VSPARTQRVHVEPVRSPCRRSLQPVRDWGSARNRHNSRSAQGVIGDNRRECVRSFARNGDQDDRLAAGAAAGSAESPAAGRETAPSAPATRRRRAHRGPLVLGVMIATVDVGPGAILGVPGVLRRAGVPRADHHGGRAVHRRVSRAGTGCCWADLARSLRATASDGGWSWR